MLEKYPTLKRALFNQTQILLFAGATAVSLAMANPLPLLLLAGGQLVTLPLLMDRFKRRMEIEKKYAARKAESMTQEQRFEQLQPDAKRRFLELRRLCFSIQDNYKGLSAESQSILAEQSEKFDSLLATVLRRLWLMEKYDSLTRSSNTDRLANEIRQLEVDIEGSQVDPRVREAWQQNLEIKRKLYATVERNRANRVALAAELDSLESLLQLLLQKSVAATDAHALSAEIDDIVAQAEADAASVQEMENMLGVMPEVASGGGLSPRLREVQLPPPLPFPAERPRSRSRQ